MKKEKYEQFCKKQKMVRISWNGEEFPNEYIYKKGQREWLMQDAVDPSKAVDIWCDQFENVKKNTVFVIFGAGYSGYIIEISNRYPDNIIIVFEPCTENVLRLIDDDILEKISNTDKLVLIAGEARFYNLEYMLYMVLRYENLPYAKYASMPNYRKIWEEEYEQFYSICKYVNEKMIMDRNTAIFNEETMGKNYLYHIKRVIAESDLYLLCKSFKNSNAINYPSVLVAAGPSLDKNVSILKAYKNKAFIICVDAALNTLYRHQIVPDMVVSVDSRIGELKAFNDDLYQELPITTVMTSSYKVYMNHKGRLFYEWEADEYTKQLFHLRDEQAIYLESGGSVANNAFSLLRKLGFQTIILIGQDLAYPDGKLHAKDAFENEGEARQEDEKYFFVEDIYGGQVLTEPNMNMYREWFEKRIENYSDLCVIDATEGGALIHGTQIMSLKKALDKYCPKDKFDFAELIQNVEYLDDTLKKEQLEEQLRLSRTNIVDIQKKLHEARHLYEKLDKINRKGKYTSNEFKKCVADIKKFTNYMNKEKDIQLFFRFVQKASYEMRETIERDEQDTYHEFKKIASSGMKMVDAYIEAGDKLEAAWKFVDSIEENNKN